MKIIKHPFAVLMLGYLLVSNTALAHNTLTSSTPSDKAVLTESPGVIELTFSDATYLEKVELVKDDGEASALAFEKSPAASRQFRVTLPPLANGDYRVSWLVIGDDTHEISGEFTFSIEEKKSKD